MVKSIISGVTTYYPSANYERKNNVVTKYYDNGVTCALQGMRVDGDVYYILADHLKSTSVTVNDQGTKIAELRYTPWGEVRYASGDLHTDKTYTGQRTYTDNFGLMFYNARWYDPEIGRFAQADNIEVKAGSTEALDRFAYVQNNPVLHNDPTGHCIDPLTSIICAMVVTATATVAAVAFGTAARAITPPPADADASSVGDLIMLGIIHTDHANITGDGLQSLQDDPSVQSAQKSLLSQITDDSGYGQQSYNVPDISSSFTANGPSGNWVKAGLMGNQAFFMVHTATLSATNTTVSEDGTVSTTWQIDDQFDYIPDWKNKGLAYNFYAVTLGIPYYGMFGAKKQFPTSASWKETIPPQKNETYSK